MIDRCSDWSGGNIGRASLAPPQNLVSVDVVRTKRQRWGCVVFWLSCFYVALMKHADVSARWRGAPTRPPTTLLLVLLLLVFPSLCPDVETEPVLCRSYGGKNTASCMF